jgi:hypothetical protein
LGGGEEHVALFIWNLIVSKNTCGDLFCWRPLIGSFSVTWLLAVSVDWLFFCDLAFGSGR